MLGIVCALPCEANALLSYAENVVKSTAISRKLYTGSLCGAPFCLIVCGVGKVNAAICTQYLINICAVNVLLNAGLAGSFTPRLPVGAVAAVTRAAQYDFDLSEVDGCPPCRLEEETQQYLTCPSDYTLKLLRYLPEASLATGDRFSFQKQDAVFIQNTLAADLRDMEGAAVFQTAKANGVPLLCVKSVSDLIGEDSPEDYYRQKERALTALGKSCKKIIEGVCHG